MHLYNKNKDHKDNKTQIILLNIKYYKIIKQ